MVDCDGYWRVEFAAGNADFAVSVQGKNELRMLPPIAVPCGVRLMSAPVWLVDRRTGDFLDSDEGVEEFAVPVMARPFRVDVEVPSGIGPHMTGVSQDDVRRICEEAVYAAAKQGVRYVRSVVIEGDGQSNARVVVRGALSVCSDEG